MTHTDLLDKALNALLWANSEINEWRGEAHGYKPEDQPQIMQVATAITEYLAQPVQEPLFWYRPVGEDGGYEGPLHNSAIEKVRKESGSWKPLYTTPPAQPAPVQEWMKPHPKCDEGCLFQCTKGFTQFPECATTPPAQPAPLCPACESIEWEGQPCQICQPAPVQDVPETNFGNMAAPVQHFDHTAAANSALRDAQNRSYQIAKLSQPAVPLTDEQIDRAAYEQTGFDGDGTQAMTLSEIRRIVRAAHGITEKGGAA